MNPHYQNFHLNSKLNKRHHLQLHHWYKSITSAFKSWQNGWYTCEMFVAKTKFTRQAVGSFPQPNAKSIECQKKSGLHTFCCTSLCDWSRKFAPFSQPIKCKTRTNGVSATRVFRPVFSSCWVLEGSGNFFLNLLWFAAVISLLLILRHLIEKRSKVKELLGIRWSQIWLQLEVSRISLF